MNWQCDSEYKSKEYIRAMHTTTTKKKAQQQVNDRDGERIKEHHGGYKPLKYSIGA